MSDTPFLGAKVFLCVHCRHCCVHPLSGQASKTFLTTCLTSYPLLDGHQQPYCADYSILQFSRSPELPTGPIYLYPDSLHSGRTKVLRVASIVVVVVNGSICHTGRWALLIFHSTSSNGQLPESCHKNCYVLVGADYFITWIEAYALSNQEVETVACKLVDELFFRFSLPQQLHLDQGRQFKSSIFKEVSSLL